MIHSEFKRHLKLCTIVGTAFMFAFAAPTPVNAADERGTCDAQFTELRGEAEHGDASAQFRLGAAYLNGVGVAKDDVEASRWYRRAAEKGDAEAQFDLGLMYDLGEGMPKDDSAAAKWWQMAAQQGLAKAQLNLGVMYHLGRGVPKDDVKADKWCTLASFSKAPFRAVLCRRYLELFMSRDAVAQAQHQTEAWQQKVGKGQ